MGAKKGKAGAPEAPTSNSSSTKQASKGTGARGAARFPNGGMTDIQKILLVNGGIAHRLRKQPTNMRPRKGDRKARGEQAA